MSQMSHDDIKQVLEEIVEISDQLAIIANILEEQKKTDKTKFVRTTSVQLMASYTINSQLAANHAEEENCSDSPVNAEMAVNDAEILWEELKKRGY